jgi:hypothetical protein
MIDEVAGLHLARSGRPVLSPRHAAVLSGIRDPSEKSIISVLGLLYVTIRSIAISQGLASMGVISAFQRQIDQIQFRVDGL